MHCLKIIFIASLFWLSTGISFAADGLLLSYGTGMGDQLIQAKSITGTEQTSLGLYWRSESRPPIFSSAQLEYEFYLSQLKHAQTLHIAAFRPVFNFWHRNADGPNWYWQFGIGISYFDGKQLDPVELSTQGQFATIFGLGMPLDTAEKHRLTLRYNHYSNGYTKNPNHGLDTLSLDWYMGF